MTTAEEKGSCLLNEDSLEESSLSFARSGHHSKSSVTRKTARASMKPQRSTKPTQFCERFIVLPENVLLKHVSGDRAPIDCPKGRIHIAMSVLAYFCFCRPHVCW